MYWCRTYRCTGVGPIGVPFCAGVGPSYSGLQVT